MSHPVWPHRQQPTRLLCPWDSPGKCTGVGCHFFLHWSSLPRDWTQVSHIVGRHFTVWASREADITEMQLQWDITTHVLEWIKKKKTKPIQYYKVKFKKFKKTPKILSFIIDMEQFADIASGTAKWCSCFEIKLGYFLENETHLYNLAIHF